MLDKDGTSRCLGSRDQASEIYQALEERSDRKPRGKSEHQKNEEKVASWKCRIREILRRRK